MRERRILALNPSHCAAGESREQSLLNIPQAWGAGLAEVNKLWHTTELCGEVPRLVWESVVAQLHRGPAWPTTLGSEELCQSNYSALGPGQQSV